MGSETAAECVVHAYSEQVSSAREIARLMEYEPGLMWLSGLGEVNYHTLADFRSQYVSEPRTSARSG